MEKELNIAAILKDKPNTKVWSDTFGELTFEYIDNQSKFPISLTAKNGNSIDLTEDGRYYCDVDGVLPCIVPSKEMRSWEKFAWKKGDVLCSKTGDSCIFVKWISADYTSFLGYYSTHKNYENEECQTAIWSKRANKEDIDQYILAIEAVKNGTLNLETLEIEQPKQKFKDGDVMFVEKTKIFPSSIFIYKDDLDNDDEDIACYAHFDYDKSEVELFGGLCIEERKYRPATDSEKQQLFAALEKEGKVWDAEKKAIVDLPKKCEFEPFDRVLVRDDKISKWCISLFSHLSWHGMFVYYICCGGIEYKYCIPYNDSTKHLLGTTDEWEGDEG